MKPQYIVAGIFSAAFFTIIILQGLEVRSINRDNNLGDEKFRSLLFRIFELCASEVISNVFLWKSIIIICWEYAELCIVLELLSLILLFVNFTNILVYVWWDMGLIITKIVAFIIFMPFFRQYILRHNNVVLGFSQENIRLIRIRNIYRASRTMFYMVNIIIYGYFTFEISLIWLIAICVLAIMDSFFQSFDDMECIEVKWFELVYSQAVFTLSLLLILPNSTLISTRKTKVRLEEFIFIFVDLVYLYYMFRDAKNFGKGLKEAAYEVKTKPFRPISH